MDVQENQRLIGLTELAGFSTRSAFLKDRSPEGLAKLYAKLGRLTDAEIEKIDASDPGGDCAPKCEYCCYRPVACTPLEALAVAIAVRNTYSADEHDALKIRLDLYEG